MRIGPSRCYRFYRYGPPQRRVPEGLYTGARGGASPTDARFVLRAAQMLRQPGGTGETFLGVKLVDPAWTRARWDHAQAALAQWRQRAGQARGRGSGLEAMTIPWKDTEGEEADDGSHVLHHVVGTPASRASCPSVSRTASPDATEPPRRAGRILGC